MLSLIGVPAVVLRAVKSAAMLKSLRFAKEPERSVSERADGWRGDYRAAQAYACTLKNGRIGNDLDVEAVQGVRSGDLDRDTDRGRGATCENLVSTVNADLACCRMYDGWYHEDSAE